MKIVKCNIQAGR